MAFSNGLIIVFIERQVTLKLEGQSVLDDTIILPCSVTKQLMCTDMCPTATGTVLLIYTSMIDNTSIKLRFKALINSTITISCYKCFALGY